MIELLLLSAEEKSMLVAALSLLSQAIADRTIDDNARALATNADEFPLPDVWTINRLAERIGLSSAQ